MLFFPRPIRADLVAVDFGVGGHAAVRVEVIPLAAYLFPAGDGLAVQIVEPAPGVVLAPAARRVAVDHDLHEPVQHGSGLGAGGGVLGAETVIALAAHNTGLLNCLHRVFHAAGNLVLVRKGHGLPRHGEGVPQLVGVLPHDNRHLFAGDCIVRAKGVIAGAADNALGGRPLHKGGVVGGVGNVGEPAGRRIACRVDTGQPPQSRYEHAPRDRAVRGKRGFRCAGEQAPAYHKINIRLGPMVHSVGERRGGVVAHAVHAEMLHRADHVSAVLVAAGLIQPFRALAVRAVHEVQAAGLLGGGGLVGEAHDGPARAEALDGDRLAVRAGVAHAQTVGRAGADGGQRVPGKAGFPDGGQGNVAGGLLLNLLQGREVKGHVHNGRVDGQPLHFGVDQPVKGGPLNDDGKAVVGHGRFRVVLYRDTVCFGLGVPSGFGQRRHRAPVVRRAGGGLALCHGHGQLDHGQHGVIRLGRFRGGDDVITAGAATATATAVTSGCCCPCDGDGVARGAAVLGGDGDSKGFHTLGQCFCAVPRNGGLWIVGRGVDCDVCNAVAHICGIARCRRVKGRGQRPIGQGQFFQRRVRAGCRRVMVILYSFGVPFSAVTVTVNGLSPTIKDLVSSPVTMALASLAVALMVTLATLLFTCAV